MPIHQPLFPTLPEVTDINQHNMGDCWFLAALAAIVAMGSGEAIKLMMRSVAVDRHIPAPGDPGRADRDARRRAPVRPTTDPHYLLVEKSLVETDVPGKTYHSTGAPWVAVLEKAMTAIDTTGQISTTQAGASTPGVPTTVA